MDNKNLETKDSTELKDIYLTWPNLITVSRIIAVILAIEAGNKGQWLLASYYIIYAAGTDWLDGWLARKLDCKSKFGAALDPIADKFFMAILLSINLYTGLIIIGLELCGMYFSNNVRKKFAGRHFIAHGSKAITFSQMTLAIILVLNRIDIFAFAQTIEREILGGLIILSLCRLFIYSSIWRNKKGQKI